jgi:GNAT superfamily N-acetyltransferase
MVRLLNELDDIECMARWNREHWSRLLDVPGDHEADVAFYKSCLQSSRLPFTVVAYKEEKLVGCCSLMSLVDGVPSALIANLFVDKSNRADGVGADLIKALKAEAVARGVETIYTWTPNLRGWYERQGFIYQQHTSHLGLEVDILLTHTS